MWTVLGPVCFDPFKSNYDQSNCTTNLNIEAMYL